MSTPPEQRAVATSVKWSFVSQAGRRVTQLATTVLLARLLAPEDFGLVGMALAVIVLVDVFKDLGTTSALVQQRQVGEPLLSSIFWIQAGAGIAAAALVAALAPLAALGFGEPEVAQLVRWLAWSFVLSGLGLTHQTLLTRDLAFERLARCEIAATVAGSAAGIGAALSGWGAKSLALQTLVFWATSTTLLWWAHPWRPRAHFRWNAVKPVVGYSLNLSAYNLVNYAARNADTLLVGVLLGPQALGFYNMAYRVMLAPLHGISKVLGRVMFPYLSSLQDDDARFGRIYLRWVGGVALVTFPLMLGLVAVAEPLVLSVLGPRWEPLVPLLLILAPAGALQSIVGTVGNIYKAKAATDRLLRFGIFGTAVTVLCYGVGIRWGVAGVAAGCTVATFVLAWPNFALAFGLIDLRVGALWKVLRTPALNALAMLAAMLLAREALGLHEPAWAPLLILASVGTASYAAASLASARAAFRELWGAIRAAV